MSKPIMKSTGPAMPITEERRAIFLRELAATGSMAHAAREASPHSRDRHGGAEGFVELARRDPEFAAQVEEAKQSALGAVEKEIHRRAMQPATRPVWHRGEKVDTAEERHSSDKMLLRVAEKLDPSWAPRSRIDSNVKIEAHLLAISVSDAMLLDKREREELARLLGKIAELRGDDDGPDDVSRLPQATERGPAS